MPDRPTVLVDDERVPMRDGVLLAADVVRLDDDVRRPVLLMRTPYGRAGLLAAHDALGAARRDWAVVMMDVRGRGQSEGEFLPFLQEVDDGFDSLAWCAEQRWSDGRVAMTGYSYNGLTQWLAAAANHPALKVISPSVIGPDLLGDFTYEGGAFQQGFLSAWALALAASSAHPETAAKAIELCARWPELLGEDAGREVVSAVLPSYADWVPPQPEYWAPGRVPLEQIALPVWRLAGWYDVFCEGTLSAYTVLARTNQAPQRLIVGPWTHIGMFNQATPEIDFGPEAAGAAFAAESEAFLRAGVDGVTPATTGVTVFVMGDNTWCDLPAWPPTTTPRAFHLGEDGMLVPAPATGDLSWKHDPVNPVPTRGGRTLQGGLPYPGPADQRPTGARDDVLAWTSGPLEDDLTVIGTVTAQLHATSTAPVFDLVVKVCDVHPDGRSLNVVDSIQRTAAPPGARTLVEVKVGSTAMTFRRGHRIQVLVCSSDSPRFDQSPAGEQTVHLAGSHLLLPVMSREATDA